MRTTATRSQRRTGFTLVEIMIVVAIIALLAAIAVPGFLRARKRSQASRVVNDLRLIDSAVDQYAIENNKATGATVGTSSWTVYMKKNSQLYNTASDLFGNSYGAQTVDTLPKSGQLHGIRCPTLRTPPSSRFTAIFDSIRSERKSLRNHSGLLGLCKRNTSTAASFDTINRISQPDTKAASTYTSRINMLVTMARRE